MKGGFYGLRGKQISLTLLALICTTILIWAWDKTPMLSSFLPPQTSSDLVTGEPLADTKPPDVSPSHSNHPQNTTTHQNNTITSPIPNKKKVNSVSTTSYNNGRDSNSTLAFVDEKDIARDSSDGHTQDTKETSGEMGSEPAKHSDVGSPGSSVLMSSYNNEKHGNSSVVDVDKKGCNYAKGKWVKDSKRPLYSGFGCKQWLSGMWACRLTQRTEFSYEYFRWQPNTCDIPEFERSSILRRMQDKTIAIIGDSLGRQQFQSLMCMLTGGEERSDVVDVGREYGLVKAHGAIRPDGWAYRFPSSNTTILYYWSASLCDLEPIDIRNPGADWAMHLDRPPAFLRKYLDKFDVVVLNTGHHWNRGKLKANRWIMHVGGVPNTNRKLAEIGGAKNFTIFSVVKWMDMQLPKHPKLKAFFRSISPRHFFNGDWNSGGSCDNTRPSGGEMEVFQDESSDSIASGAVKDTGVKLLDITALSQLRDEGHISRYSIKATPGVQDCLHWCLPGVPDTWNEILLSQV